MESMALIQDLMTEIQDLKESREILKEEVKDLKNQLDQMNVTELVDRVNAVEQYCPRVDNLDTATKNLQDRVGQYPDPDELKHCVTWDFLQTTLVNERQKAQKEIRESLAGPDLGARATIAPFSAYVDAEASDVTPGSGTDDQDEEALPKTSLPDEGQVSKKNLSRVSSGAERYPETVEALKEVGQLGERHNILQGRVELLEVNKADEAQLTLLQKLLADMGDREMPDNLMDQVNNLRVLVDSLVGDRAKNNELMNHIQEAITQLQSGCENLQDNAKCLLEDQSQKRDDIEHLFKSVEQLEKKKADKELVEMEIEIKADKDALENKVSCMQFDTMTKQLNTMFQELLGKVLDQEQDWHNVIEKISTEMESKLNQIELDPVKNQLEDRWKTIRKQLQVQPAPKDVDAAGIRRQLVAKFHCISCARPVDMHTLGPHMYLPTVPRAPGLPTHMSIRPYITYELEQVRQHSRSDQYPEMVHYSYQAMSRSCGGRHTTNHPNHRLNRLQPNSNFSRTDDDPRFIPPCTPKQFQPEEVDIKGFDGQIYKGRINTRTVKNVDARLPTISSKDATCNSKEKILSSLSQKSSSTEPGCLSRTRPQSAKPQRTSSASGSSVRARTVSSLECRSPVTLPQSSTFDDTTTELEH
ncbi:hypothetical protein UPYG_G00106860 [Umbra pygmaea]|uniref:DUF4795 domain-containing protein n=1 Tax=Umbra pygmaea TaxID=75934 RepID=A0ABD0XHP7_UMBPY